MKDASIYKTKLFSSLLEEAKDKNIFEQRTLRAIDWYKSRVFELVGPREIEPTDIVKDKSRNSSPEIGGMFMFQYDPKHKNTLSYYDTNPLVLVIDQNQDGFMGLNFHYIRNMHKALLLNALYNYEVYSIKHKETIINISYNVLKSASALRYYKPTLKRYLYKNMIGSFSYRVHPSEWPLALFLPTQNFMKASYSEVLKNSSRMIK